MPSARACRPAVAPRATVLRARTQAGFGLVEVVVSLALVTTVVLALAGGLLMLVNTTRQTSEQQQIQIALTAMTESLLVGPYLPCPVDAGVADYGQAYAAWPARWTPTKPGMQASIVGVEYWSEADDRFVDACPAQDDGAQRLEVEVTWQGRSDTAQVVTAARP